MRTAGSKDLSSLALTKSCRVLISLGESSMKETRRVASSIKSHGLLQPVVIRIRRWRYELIAGEKVASKRTRWTG